MRFVRARPRAPGGRQIFEHMRVRADASENLVDVKPRGAYDIMLFKLARDGNLLWFQQFGTALVANCQKSDQLCAGKLVP